MQVNHNGRGFEIIDLPGGGRLQQSSAIGDYEDSFNKPGSSYLWYGEDHLDREDARRWLEKDLFDQSVVPHVEAWLKTGSLEL